MREKIEPIYDINEWITADPDWAALIQEARVGDDPPVDRHNNIFYPIQQDPQGGFPYVRYMVSLSVDPNTHWLQRDQVLYAMYFVNTSDSAQAMNILVDKMKRGDEAAAKLNDWLAGEEYGHEILFEYHSLEITSAGETEPTSERGGSHARLVNFTYNYTPLT